MERPKTDSRNELAPFGTKTPSGVNFTDWPAGIEIDQIEHIDAPEAGDTISLLARLHAEARMSERAQALELADYNPVPVPPRRSTPKVSTPAFIVAAWAAAWLAGVGAMVAVGLVVRRGLEVAGVL